MLPQVLLSSAHRSPGSRPTAVSLGNFDGVHRGHAVLLARLVQAAASRGLQPLVCTFEPSPAEVFRPDQPARRLLSLADRVARLGDLGVEVVCVERFSTAFAAHPADWFAREILARRLGARLVVAGTDFRFGQGRGGDAALVRDLLGIDVEQIDPVVIDEEVVSSTRIRGLVEAGEVSRAAALLGRPHATRGTVVRGDQRGRVLGFPTANLDAPGLMRPASGVYATRVWIDSHGPFPSVTNLGVRPTFSGLDERLEVHVLDLGPDDPEPTYGRDVRLEWVERLRPERNFPGVDALVTAIRRDVEAARRVLGVG